MFFINAVTAQEIIEKLGTYYSNMLYVINKEKKENLDNDN
jgi:hypothetical protein